MLPEGWEEDFWLKTPFGTFSLFTSDDNEPESNPKKLVYVLNHPQVISYKS
jgi:hypothetical protein